MLNGRKIGKYDVETGPVFDNEDRLVFKDKSKAREIYERLMLYAHQHPQELIKLPSPERAEEQCELFHLGDCSLTYHYNSDALNPAFGIIHSDPKKRKDTLKLLERILS